MNTTQTRVMNLLADHLGETHLKPEHDLEKDLQCDSLDRVETMIALEEEFNIDIIEDDFDKLQTIQQIIDFIEGVRSADASTVKTAFIAAEEFIAGFEDDTTQQGITDLLANLRKAIAHTHVRERYIATLNKAGLDCAMELDWIKNEFPVPDAKRETITQMIERMHAASAEVTA